MSLPQVIRVDEDGILTGGDFAEMCDRFDIKIDPIAGEAPRQMGRHSKQLKIVKEMALDLFKEDDELEMEEAAGLLETVKNERHLECGCASPSWFVGE